MLMNENFRSEQGSDFKKRKMKEIKVGRLLSHAIARWEKKRGNWEDATDGALRSFMLVARACGAV
jgi:hypothetical protein